MRKFMLFTLLLFILILFFQNLDKGIVRLLFWQFEFSIGFWILSAFLSGLLFGYLFGIFKSSSSKKIEDGAKNRNAELDEEEEYLKP